MDELRFFQQQLINDIIGYLNIKSMRDSFGVTPRIALLLAADRYLALSRFEFLPDFREEHVFVEIIIYLQRTKKRHNGYAETDNNKQNI